MKKIHREVDRLFSEFFGKPKVMLPEGFREPLVNVYETSEEVVVAADLPGVNKEDISLNATEDMLEIKAEVKRKEEVEYQHKERRYKGFYRKISLPAKVDVSKAKASYVNGVLEVRLPKIEVSKKVNIPIE